MTKNVIVCSMDNEIERLMSKLEKLDPVANKDEYVVILNRITELQKMRTEQDKVELEETKAKTEAEDKKTRNKLDLAKTIIGAVGGIGWVAYDAVKIAQVLKFEETGSVSSFVGRQIIKFGSKIFK